MSGQRTTGDMNDVAHSNSSSHRISLSLEYIVRGRSPSRGFTGEGICRLSISCPLGMFVHEATVGFPLKDFPTSFDANGKIYIEPPTQAA